MSQETKSQAFQRLAQARKEALLDKVRHFGQLSGPSYEWTPQEVWDHFTEIAAALEQAMARFQEQKRWGAGETGEGVEAEAEASAGAEADNPESPAEPEISREQRRRKTIGDLIQAAQNDTELLPELIVLHKLVIDFQQAVIDELRAQLPKIVS